MGTAAQSIRGTTTEKKTNVESLPVRRGLNSKLFWFVHTELLLPKKHLYTIKASLWPRVKCSCLDFCHWNFLLVPLFRLDIWFWNSYIYIMTELTSWWGLFFFFKRQNNQEGASSVSGSKMSSKMVQRAFGLSVWSNLTAALASLTTRESLRLVDHQKKYITWDVLH